MISIVIVNFHTYKELTECLESIKKNKIDYEVIVIDNEYIEIEYNKIKAEFSNSNIRIFPEHKNLGFPAAANKGAGYTKGGFLLFLNPDIVLEEDSLEKSLEFYKLNNVGILGCQQISEDGKIQLSFGRFPNFLREFQWKNLWKLRSINYRKFLSKVEKYISSPTPVDWVSGSFLLISKDVYNSVEGFNKDFFIYYEDIDLCRRVKSAGYEVIYNPDIKFKHYHGKSAATNPKLSSKEYRNSQVYYYKKYNNAFQNFLLKIYLVFNGAINV